MGEIGDTYGVNGRRLVDVVVFFLWSVALRAATKNQKIETKTLCARKEIMGNGRKATLASGGTRKVWEGGGESRNTTERQKRQGIERRR